jgi:lysophospholipase L1-like esterase
MPTMLPILTILFVLGSAATTPQQRDGWHAERHQRINDTVASRQGAVDLVFVGDSITQGWEGAGRTIWEEAYGPRRAVNIGISGDRTEHVLWRLDHGNLDGITPKVAVVMIGTNNISHNAHSTDEVLAGVQAVVKRIREISPNARVLLLGIFPRCFFFNDTAATEIYTDRHTLSLPGALPMLKGR